MVSISTLMIPMALLSDTSPPSHHPLFLTSPFLCPVSVISAEKKCGLLFCYKWIVLMTYWTRIDGSISFPGVSQIVLSYDLRLSAALSMYL